MFSQLYRDYVPMGNDNVYFGSYVPTIWGEDPSTILKMEIGLSSKTFITIKYMTLCPKICNLNVLQNFDKIKI